MSIRRKAREKAIQFLFQCELNPPGQLEEALNYFWETQRTVAIEDEKGKAHWGQPVELPPPTTEELAVRAFADPLIKGAIEFRAQADEIIQKYTKNWKLNRIAVVDRNILRLAVYEMHHRHDIPPVVSINEAIDLAKKFSTEESGRFVNGILDKVRENLMRPARIVQ